MHPPSARLPAGIGIGSQQFEHGLTIEELQAWGWYGSKAHLNVGVRHSRLVRGGLRVGIWQTPRSRNMDVGRFVLFLLSLVWGSRMVIFQLFGFDCIVTNNTILMGIQGT